MRKRALAAAAIVVAGLAVDPDGRCEVSAALRPRPSTARRQTNKQRATALRPVVIGTAAPAHRPVAALAARG